MKQIKPRVYSHSDVLNFSSVENCTFSSAKTILEIHPPNFVGVTGSLNYPHMTLGMKRYDSGHKTGLLAKPHDNVDGYFVTMNTVNAKLTCITFEPDDHVMSSEERSGSPPYILITS